MEKIVIGKHTLESLTSGMYSDPFVVYREYIQNAVDSIDEAVRSGILQKGEEVIDVVLHSSEKCVEIIDNGLGVSAELVESTLLSIGNSNKTANISRGFRGIGRLSGLSYCTTLIFETSCLNEPIGSRIIIDSQKLANIISSKQNMESSVLEVLNKIYTVAHFRESSKAHYFRVRMICVDEATRLLDASEVISYLSQNAPVPYNEKAFVFGREIIKRLASLGYDIHSYNVYLTHQHQRNQIFKPYADTFLADKGKHIFDKIIDIQIIDFKVNEQVIAVGWFGKTNYLGSIYDRSIKGIRLRSGNIMVGDSQTANTFFKDARFNGWSIGEIFTLDSELIPNARRDNYEKNQTYFSFAEKLTNLAGSITKEIRAKSLKRNSDLSAALEETSRIISAASVAIGEGITPSQKTSLKLKITSAQNEICHTKVSDFEAANLRDVAFEELDILIGTVQGATSYKVLNTMKGISSSERKTLEKVIDLIIEYGHDNANDLIDFILANYIRGSEKRS